MRPMEFAEVIRRRRMVRRFKNQSLPSDVVDRVLANATRGPSAGFAQGWAFLVLTEQADRERFWPFVPNQTKHTPEVMNAPLVIVPLAHRTAYFDTYDNSLRMADWPAPYWFIDTGMAALMMLLTAVDEGLDAFFFWLMPPADEIKQDGRVAAHLDAFRSEFAIPDDYTPVGAIAMGYRTDDLAPQSPELSSRRRDNATVMHHGQWNGSGAE